MPSIALQPGAWTAGFAVADLNALAINAQDTSSLAAPQINNSTGAIAFVQFEVVLAALSPTAGACIVVALIPETSQTPGTYVTGVDGTVVNDQVRWQNHPNAIIALRLTASSAQTQRSAMIPIGPDRYRLVVINRSGVALAASGNMVYYRTITEAVV